MTGAPVPGGADTVVMVEHSRRGNGAVEIDRSVEAGQNICRQATEARAGDVVLRAGIRIDYSHVALAASIGRARLKVFQRPEIAIVSTGDEIVAIESVPSLSRFATRTPLRWPRRLLAPAVFPAICRLCAIRWTALARLWNGPSNRTWC